MGITGSERITSMSSGGTSGYSQSDRARDGEDATQDPIEASQMLAGQRGLLCGGLEQNGLFNNLHLIVGLVLQRRMIQKQQLGDRKSALWVTHG